MSKKMNPIGQDVPYNPVQLIHGILRKFRLCKELQGN